MATILVTGGAGYIGSHTVKELIDEGYNVLTYDNLSSGHKEAVLGGHFIEGDLADKLMLDLVFKKNDIDVVVHFAGFIEAGASVQNPGDFIENNVSNGINLLEAMVTRGVKKIVFSSSAGVYGDPEKIPISEEDPKNPVNTYGLSKLIFEQILERYEIAYGIKSISLRYFNAGGADLSGKIGDDHKNKTHIIAQAILTVLGQNDAFYLFGTDYDTPDGACIRDHIHVSDLAKAHILAIDSLFSGSESNIYNLGSEKGYSNRQVIDTVKKITGVDFKICEAERREGDPTQLVASSEKIKKELGWKPQYDNLDIIVESAWKWHKNHPQGYKTSKKYQPKETSETKGYK